MSLSGRGLKSIRGANGGGSAVLRTDDAVAGRGTGGGGSGVFLSLDAVVGRDVADEPLSTPFPTDSSLFAEAKLLFVVAADNNPPPAVPFGLGVSIRCSDVGKDVCDDLGLSDGPGAWGCVNSGLAGDLAA